MIKRKGEFARIFHFPLAARAPERRERWSGEDRWSRRAAATAAYKVLRMQGFAAAR
jgi:hypothetical protein